MSSKLESLIQKHKDDRDQLALALGDLREEMIDGRGYEETNSSGLTGLELAFHDLIQKIGIGDAPITNDQKEKLVSLTQLIVDRLSQSIRKVNFWTNQTAIGQLQGEIKELVFIEGIEPMIDRADQIKTEVTALAKKRHHDLLQR